MLTETEINCVLYASGLPGIFPGLWESFSSLITAEGHKSFSLKSGFDLSLKDFLPLQISKNNFIRFQLDNDARTLPEKNTEEILSLTDEIHIKVKQSDIVLLNRNITCSKNKAIVTDKIFSDNPLQSKKVLAEKLIKLLQVDSIIFIPHPPANYGGHASGIIRFINNNFVLLSCAMNPVGSYKTRLVKELKKQGIEYVPCPFYCPKPSDKKGAETTVGSYISYIQTAKSIFLPLFNHKYDEAMYHLVSDLYPYTKIFTLDCKEIAKNGLLLNNIFYTLKT